jgi:diacylglycerol kinase family enzyme
MRIALLHNKSAGSENHAADEIEEAITRAGHDVVTVASELAELLRVLPERTCDLVVIAGGDGTVSRTASALAGRHVPLAILPLGTANNTAKTLGLEGTVDELIASWADARAHDYDLGTIQLAGDTLRPFSEVVGWGVFPALMARTEELSSPDQREHTLERDRRLFREEIARAKAHAYEIEADGTLLRGDFLLVELVNIPFIGAQLELSPESAFNDGRFELVLAGEPERTALIELAGGGKLASDVRLPTRRVKHAIVRSDREHLHLDGSLLELAQRPSECSVTVEPASVQYLVGASAA